MINWPDLTFPPLNLWNFPKQPQLYKEHKMKISMTDTNGTYTIETEEEFVGLSNVIDFFIRPLLYAAGYSPDIVLERIPEEEELLVFVGKGNKPNSDDGEMSDWFVEFELDDEVVEKKAAVAKKAVCAAPKEAVAKKAV